MASVEEIVESAFSARIQQNEGLIADMRETLSHSTWLATLAVGVMAASATLSSDSASGLILGIRAATLLFAGISVVLGTLVSVTANNRMWAYRQLVIGALGERENY